MRSIRKNKKGQVFGQLGTLGVGVATLAIVLVVTFLIMSQAKTQIGDIEGIDTSNPNASECRSSVACNSTSTLQNAVSDIPGWVPLVIIASIGAILLGLVSLFQRR